MPFKDPEKSRQYKHAHYLANKDQYRKRHRKYRASNKKQKRDYYNKYKIEKGCLICGYNKCYGALEFHHLDSEKKDRNINIMIAGGWRQERIEEEIAKCVILCANCHREVHARLIDIKNDIHADVAKLDETHGT